MMSYPMPARTRRPVRPQPAISASAEAEHPIDDRPASAALRGLQAVVPSGRTRTSTPRAPTESTPGEQPPESVTTTVLDRSHRHLHVV